MTLMSLKLIFTKPNSMYLQLNSPYFWKLFIINLLVISFFSCETQQSGSSVNTESENESNEINQDMVGTHTSRNALDWSGTYTGTLPCADCEGIETMIRLNDDQTYLMKTRYLGESNQIFETGGTFSWNESAANITLENAAQNSGPVQYKVGENMLIQLDQQGKSVSGDLASKYKLQKAMPALTDHFWKLHSVYGNIIAWDQDNGKHPHLIFKSEENKIVGYNGCNSINGNFEVNDYKITLSQLASTRMACPESDLETQFMQALEETDSYFIKDDIMALSNQEDQEIARFEVVYIRNGESGL